MKSRREFYSSRPDAPPSSLEDRGETPLELCPFYTPDEPVSLVLEYKPPEVESDPNTNIKVSSPLAFFYLLFNPLMPSNAVRQQK